MKIPWQKLLSFCVLILCLPILAIGQFKLYTANGQSLDATRRFWRVQSSITPKARADITNITLLDTGAGSIVHYDDVVFYDEGATGKATGFRITSAPLDKGGSYLLLVTVIARKADGSFDKVETDTKAVTLDSITVSLSGQGGPPGNISAASNRPKPILKIVKSKAKNDSDFFFAGEMVVTSGEKAAFTTEVKIEPRFGSGVWTYSPFFHLNASSDPKADPDKMDLGFRAYRSFPFRYKETGEWRPRVTSVYLSLGGKIEAERDFDNANLITDPILDFAISPFPIGKKATLTLDPIVGTELGKNLKSPLPAAQGAGIARVFGSLRTVLDIPIGSAIDRITFSGDYTRRWLLKSELSFKVSDDGTLSLVEFGRSPRDFVETKLEFGINKFFGPYIAYDWGQEPPSYKLIDHRVRVGFTYKFKLSK